MSITRELIIKLYQYFYSKVYHRKDFEYNPSSKELVTIDKFLEILEFNNSFGEDWLFNYFAFQFEYWSNLKYKKIKSVIIGYILGPKAFERFDQRNEQSGYFTQEFILNYNIDRDVIFGSRYYRKDLLNISKSEEIEKQRFSNDIERLANCFFNTTLFNIKSKICVLCRQSRLCKKLQQEKLPQIYKLRNEKNI